MGLDIEFVRRKKNVCPHCGTVVGYTEISSIDGGGRGWYPMLEKIGYYVPYDQRTEENDWYGKDMILNDEQTDYLYHFAKEHDLYGSDGVLQLIATARYEGNEIVINADW